MHPDDTLSAYAWRDALQSLLVGVLMYHILNKNGEVIAFIEKEKDAAQFLATIIEQGPYKVEKHIDPEPAPQFVPPPVWKPSNLAYVSMYAEKVSKEHPPKAQPPQQFKPWKGGTVDELAKVFPNITAIVKHPLNSRKLSINEIIVDLNDHQGWSRGKIADWLESLDIDLAVTSGKEGN